MKYKKTKANKERAERIAATIECYDSGDKETSMADMLADVMHYARQNRIDFSEVLGRADSHFVAEAGGEP